MLWGIVTLIVQERCDHILRLKPKPSRRQALNHDSPLPQSLAGQAWSCSGLGRGIRFGKLREAPPELNQSHAREAQQIW